MPTPIPNLYQQGIIRPPPTIYIIYNMKASSHAILCMAICGLIASALLPGTRACCRALVCCSLSFLVSPFLPLSVSVPFTRPSPLTHISVLVQTATCLSCTKNQTVGEFLRFSFALSLPLPLSLPHFFCTESSP